MRILPNWISVHGNSSQEFVPPSEMPHWPEEYLDEDVMLDTEDWRPRSEHMHFRSRVRAAPSMSESSLYRYTIIRTRRKRKNAYKSSNLTRNELVTLADTYKRKCFYCNVRMDGFVFYPRNPTGFDHIVPVSAGGRHEAWNMVPCCFKCNLHKRDYSLKELEGLRPWMYRRLVPLIRKHNLEAFGDAIEDEKHA